MRRPPAWHGLALAAAGGAAARSCRALHLARRRLTAPADAGRALTPRCCADGDAANGGDDEAEYAWLPPDNLKPFYAGDTTGQEDGLVRGAGAAWLAGWMDRWLGLALRWCCVLELPA